MKALPQESDIRNFRSYLDQQGYSTATLTERLGRARPPAEGEERQMFDDSRQITAPNILIRLFLLGASVDETALLEFLPEPIVAFCLDTGLVEVSGGVATGRVVIIPVEDLLFASDAFRMLGTDKAAEFVLPASTHSANFLRLLTLRDAVDTTLDLGCGCGIHALFAARHSQSVVATDVSVPALWYTRFNAMLNGLDNVECIEGSLFEPVEGRRFDLIISNPPFVVSPSASFEYRDNTMELDQFCRELVKEAPGYLQENGYLQMLCEWVEVEGQSWQERISEWIRGCDAWVLHSFPQSPTSYVQQRSQDIVGESVNMGEPKSWIAYLEQHRVRAIHPGMLTLRRRSGQNWLHVQNLTGDVTAAAGDVIANGIAAVDFLESCDDESLLDATLKISDALVAERLENDGNVTGICLKMNNALAADAEIDGAVAAFLNLFDGKRTIHECVGEFAKATAADLDSLTSDLLSIVRVFTSRGFLEPVEVE